MRLFVVSCILIFLIIDFVIETQAEAEDEQLDGEEAGSLEDTSQCEDQSDSGEWWNIRLFF